MLLAGAWIRASPSQSDGIETAGGIGIIYAQGTNLMKDGAPIQLFGTDDQYVAIYAQIASGLWGAPDSSAWGRNLHFPEFLGKIPDATDMETHWREYFRYFVHYNQVAGSSTSPKMNLLRIWIADNQWNAEGPYYAWKNNPTAFWNMLDRMVYWAKQAGIYLVPVFAHYGAPADGRLFNTASIEYAHQVELVRAVMTRYDNEPQIAMWDLFNEPEGNNEAYFNNLGGISAYRAWATRYVADVRSASQNHLITIGSANSPYLAGFGGIPADESTYEFFAAYNDIPGMDVTHHHIYSAWESQTAVIDIPALHHATLGKPHYEGEVGYWQSPGPVPQGYGYWPWYTQRSLAAGWSAVSNFLLADNGKGPYADYPYTGPLPAYPTGGPFDFTVSLSYTSGSVAQGNSVVTTATSTLTSGATQPVTFSASGLPSGATATFSTPSCNPTCSPRLTISTSSTTPMGTYNVLVSATNGTATKTTSYVMTVKAPPVCSPMNYPSTSWQRVWYDMTLTTCLGDGPNQTNAQFDDNWDLGTVAWGRAENIGFKSSRTINLPTTGTYTFSAGSDDGIRIRIDGTLVLDKWLDRPYTIDTFARTLAAGNHQFELDYYDSVQQARVSFGYTAPSLGLDFSLSLNPTSDRVTQGSSANTTATATLTSVTTEPVSFSASGLPSGTTATFSSTSCNPTCASVLRISTSSITPPGSYSVVVTATGGGITRTATYLLTVPYPPCPSSPSSYPSTTWDRVWCNSNFISKLADTPDQTTEQFDNNWDLGNVGGIRNSDIGFRSGRTLSLNAGTYTFTLGSDDGSRLWIDGTSCVDMWINQAYTERSCTRTFSSAGSHQLRIDYYEGTWDGDGGQARVRFGYTAAAVDTAPPTVSSIGPIVAAVNTTTTFSVNANDNVAIASCTFYWNGISVGTMTQSGSTFSKSHTPTKVGTHIALVQCVDPSGNTGTNTGFILVSEILPIDSTPPATIIDLRVVLAGGSSITLQWIAPGDDDVTGSAKSYDLRYSTSGPITESNFYAATRVDIPVPRSPGSAEQVTIMGLHVGTRYWFALRAADEIPNWSPVSNSPSGETRAGIPTDGFEMVTSPEGVPILLAFVGSFGGLAVSFLMLRRRRRSATESDLPRW